MNAKVWLVGAGPGDPEHITTTDDQKQKTTFLKGVRKD